MLLNGKIVDLVSLLQLLQPVLPVETEYVFSPKVNNIVVEVQDCFLISVMQHHLLRKFCLNLVEIRRRKIFNFPLSRLKCEIQKPSCLFFLWFSEVENNSMRSRRKNETGGSQATGNKVWSKVSNSCTFDYFASSTLQWKYTNHLWFN